ncbi:hypothetical protein O181_038292 [Austropuccinia psidii MF-1]|uniref:Uncharacterized protein n=1 Tax=Austropuccinia psidii MF-1 TaxID=1389203 RepID=A0A9Q3DAN4_9BASI|nr:hypothetical protein [Austropuccinia psidii MF-1]
MVPADVDTNSQGSDEKDGEELEATTPIHRRRIEYTSISPVQANTTTHEVIRCPKSPQAPNRSPTRPSTLASTSTSFQTPMASISRYPMSLEP